MFISAPLIGLKTASKTRVKSVALRTRRISSCLKNWNRVLYIQWLNHSSDFSPRQPTKEKPFQRSIEHAYHCCWQKSHQTGERASNPIFNASKIGLTLSFSSFPGQNTMKGLLWMKYSWFGETYPPVLPSIYEPTHVWVSSSSPSCLSVLKAFTFRSCCIRSSFPVAWKENFLSVTL